MNPVAKILCVSPDPMLLQTRRWILEGYFQVDCAGRLSEAAAMIESQSYDLILLCYSLSAEECRQVHKLARAKAPETQLLALTEKNDGCAEAYSDMQIPVAQGPYALLKTVAEMIAPELGNQLNRKTRRSSLIPAIEAKLPPIAVTAAELILPLRRKRV